MVLVVFLYHIVREMCHQYVSFCFKVQRLCQNSSLYWCYQALAPPLQHCHEGGHPPPRERPQQRLSTNLVGHLHVLGSANLRPIIGELFCTYFLPPVTWHYLQPLIFCCDWECWFVSMKIDFFEFYTSNFCLSVHDCELSFPWNYEIYRYMALNACAAFLCNLGFWQAKKR